MNPIFSKTITNIKKKLKKLTHPTTQIWNFIRKKKGKTKGLILWVPFTLVNYSESEKNKKRHI